MPDFSFDGHSLDDLARDLRESALRIRVQTDRTLVKVVETVAVTARAIASDSIKPTIKTDFAPGLGRVYARGGFAAVNELGNKGKRASKTFWHPVFGHRNVTIAQERHPFLARARLADRKEATKLMNAAWEEALRPFTRKG